MQRASHGLLRSQRNQSGSDWHSVMCTADNMDTRPGCVKASHSLDRYGNARVPNEWVKYMDQKGIVMLSGPGENNSISERPLVSKLLAQNPPLVRQSVWPRDSWQLSLCRSVVVVVGV